MKIALEVGWNVHRTDTTYERKEHRFEGEEVWRGVGSVVLMTRSHCCWKEEDTIGC